MAFLPRVRRLFASRPPAASIEIAADRVTGVALERGRQAGLSAVVTEPLPDGALVPAANASNLIDRAAVSEAVARVLRQIPGNPRRVGLVLPDSAAKVSLMTFENVPAAATDLDQLVRWQARKAAPFRIEDTQVAYSAGMAGEDGAREFVVSLMRRDIVEEYESVCTAAGGHAGVVDLASFSQLNAILVEGTGGDGDWLLIHVAQGYSTIAVVRHGHLILFRNRPADGEGNLANLVHQTTMYYEDRLEGAGFGQVFLAASAANTTAEAAEVLRDSLQLQLGVSVNPITCATSGAGQRGVGPLPDLVAAPLGLLLRERSASETGV
jgi:type IV pilus assembly protein PilM